jgi:hypothetical protein
LARDEEAEAEVEAEAGRYTREEMDRTWWRSACRMSRAAAPRTPVRTEVDVMASMTRVPPVLEEEFAAELAWMGRLCIINPRVCASKMVFLENAL